MDDLRNVIGHGQNNDGSKWYIVSDKNKVTGKLWKAGQRVTVTPDSDCQKCEEYTCGHLDLATELETILDQELIETIKERIIWPKINGENYSCTCLDFRNSSEEDCIHISSYKHFDNALKTDQEGFITQKKADIEALTEQIAELKSDLNHYEQEKESLRSKVKNLNSQLKNSDQESKEEIRKRIEQAEEKYQQATTQLKDKIDQQEQTIIHLNNQEEELIQSNLMLEEKVETEVKRVNKAELIANGLSKRRFNLLYQLPEETQGYILGLGTLEPETINDILAPVIYAQIPTSNTPPKTKIRFGTKEHHRSKGYKPFLEKIAQIKTINSINPSWSESTNGSEIKAIYQPNDTMPNGQKANSWTILMVYSSGDFGCRLYVETTARNKVEAKLVSKEIEKKS
ncbi:hypothetical protein HOI26_02585 [Candidatus Woesearchaeota archaeon]|jgi:hypothetical protein|nr:hypothetical protein [Candidatus Woesearchaeota archaeon]MBT5739964.1 hypothetical protein [Candidatus Woesearchaeota archaeon]